MANKKQTQVKISKPTEFREYDVKKVMDKWNSINGLPKVRGTDNLKHHIIGSLKRNTSDKICKSIERYGIIFNDTDYFFDYKWTLQGFVSSRDIINKFDDKGTLWFSYQERKKQTSQRSVAPPRARAEAVSTEVDREEKGLTFIPNYAETIQHLKEIPYDDYLNTEHWKYFSKRARHFFNNKCCVCDDTKQVLDVHHKTYENRGREMYDDVILLCRNCHGKVHNKV